MMLKKTDQARISKLAARLRTLVFREGILEGTVTNMTVGGSKRTTFTDKVDGKTRCLYVAQRNLAEVERLSANWKEARRILQAMSALYREDMISRMKDSSRASASSNATVQAEARGKTPKATAFSVKRSRSSRVTKRS